MVNNLKVFCPLCQQKVETFDAFVSPFTKDNSKKLFCCVCGYSGIIYYEGKDFYHVQAVPFEYNPSHRLNGISTSCLKMYGYKLIKMFPRGIMNA